jgi:hypothetical protein
MINEFQLSYSHCFKKILNKDEQKLIILYIKRIKSKY